MPQAHRRRFTLSALARAVGICAFSVLLFGFAPIGPPPAREHSVRLGRHGHHSHRHHVRKHRHRHGAHPRVHRAAAASCANADGRAATLSLDQARAAVICLINDQRTERGLPVLTESAKLDRAAQDWTTHMVLTAEFSHGTNFSARISAVGYQWQTAGENIAAGQSTPRAVVDAWMASLGHCQNILQPEFRDVGAGLSTTPVPAWGTLPVTWTTDFGLSAGESPLSHDTGPASGCPYH